MNQTGTAGDAPGAAKNAYTALVLAGRRPGTDWLAREFGAPHRAFLEIQGQPMLERVIETLRSSPWVRRALVSIDRPELVDQVKGLSARIEEGFLRVIPSANSPSQSVAEALDGLPSEESVLVTTADHALLDTKMLDHFLRAAETRGPDVAVALVAETVLCSRFPESKRTYIRFRGESYSGANLFAFRTPRAREAALFWRRAERYRKQPWRMVSSFGARNLLLFALRRLDLTSAFERVSTVIGVRVTPIEMPWAEAAVDVDTASDLALVNRILS